MMMCVYSQGLSQKYLGSFFNQEMYCNQNLETVEANMATTESSFFGRCPSGYEVDSTF